MRQIVNCINTLNDPAATPQELYNSLHEFYDHYKDHKWAQECFPQFQNDIEDISAQALHEKLSEASNKFAQYRNEHNALSIFGRRTALLKGLENAKEYAKKLNNLALKKQQAKEAKQQAKKAKQQAKKAKQQVEEAEQQLALKKQQIEEAEQQAKKAKQQVKEAEQQLALKKQQAEEAEQQLAEEAKQIENVREYIEKFRKNVFLVKENLIKAKDEKKSVQYIEEKIKKEIEQLKNETEDEIKNEIKNEIEKQIGEAIAANEQVGKYHEATINTYNSYHNDLHGTKNDSNIRTTFSLINLHNHNVTQYLLNNPNNNAIEIAHNTMCNTYNQYRDTLYNQNDGLIRVLQNLYSKIYNYADTIEQCINRMKKLVEPLSIETGESVSSP